MPEEQRNAPQQSQSSLHASPSRRQQMVSLVPQSPKTLAQRSVSAQQSSLLPHTSWVSLQVGGWHVRVTPAQTRLPQQSQLKSQGKPSRTQQNRPLAQALRPQISRRLPQQSRVPRQRSCNWLHWQTLSLLVLVRGVQRPEQHSPSRLHRFRLRRQAAAPFGFASPTTTAPRPARSTRSPARRLRTIWSCLANASNRGPSMIAFL
jgi:hypothetical protein